jgi:hypothetical protein
LIEEAIKEIRNRSNNITITVNEEGLMEDIFKRFEEKLYPNTK